MYLTKFILIFFAVLLLSTKAMSNSSEQSVSMVLDNFHQAAAQADGKTYFSLLSKNAVFLGTDASERWSKTEFKSFAKPYFSKGKGWTYLPRDRHINFSPDGQTAWFDELLDNTSYGECRGTGVLVKVGERWLISQYHLTIPLPNALVDEITERIDQHKKQLK
jgi:hypothetical protein